MVILPGKETEWHGGIAYVEKEYPNILFAKDDYILKSPMRRIHKIKTKTVVKEVISDLWILENAFM